MVSFLGATPPQDKYPRFASVRELQAESKRSIDQASLERALQELLELWEEDAFLDPEDPSLTADQRMAAGDCARLVADLDRFDRLPAGWSRQQVLARARAFLTPSSTSYPREDRARIEADYIVETAVAGDFAGALGLALAARRDFADVPQILIDILLLEANYFQVLGRYEEAVASAHEARELLEDLTPDQLPSPYVGILSRVVEGMTLVAMGLPDLALPLLKACEVDLLLPDNQGSEALVLTFATQLRLARDDFDWVIESLAQRLESGPVGGETPQDTEARWLDVKVARARKSLQESSGLEAAHADLEAFLSAGSVATVAGMDGPLALAELDLALDNPERARDRLDELERQLDERLSNNARLPRLAVTELMGRVHLRLGSGADELAPLREELQLSFQDLLGAWDTAPDREGGVGFLLFDFRSSLLATLIRVTLALEPGVSGTERSLGYLLQAERRSTLAAKLAPREVTAQAIRSELAPEGGGILTYLPSPHGSVLFAITRDQVRVFDVADSRRLRDLNTSWCGTWVDDKAVSSPENAERLARELLAELLPEQLLRDVVHWSSATVVGSESFNFVPFEALPSDVAGSPSLGLVLPINYLPSLSVGLGLRRNRWSSAPVAVGPLVSIVVGKEEVLGSDGIALSALPWNSRDFDSLSAPWTNELVALDTSPGESRSAVLEAGSQGILLLEVIAHGVRSTEHERAQGLAFGGQTNLYPDDLVNQTTPPLVVLAVCDAGRGLLRIGDEGITHMGGALLGAGSRCVALSRYDLSFEASLGLLAALNRHLGAGVPVSKAMLYARREVASVAKWQHPRFHALLHVYGDGLDPAPPQLWGAPALESTRTTLVIVTGIALLVIFAIVLAFARSGKRGRP